MAKRYKVVLRLVTKGFGMIKSKERVKDFGEVYTAEVIRAYNSIWGIDILPDNCEETKKRMLDMCPEYADKSKMPLNIICGDSLKIMEQLKEGADNA